MIQKTIYATSKYRDHLNTRNESVSLIRNDFFEELFSIFHYFAFQKLSTMFGWFSSKFLTLLLFLSVTPARCCEDPFLCHDLPLFLRQWFTLARRPIHWVQSIKSFLFWTLYIRHIIIMNSLSIKHFIPIQNIAEQIFLLFVLFVFSFLVCCLFGHFLCNYRDCL